MNALATISEVWNWIIGADLQPSLACLRHKWVLVVPIMILNFGVACGYMLIAWHWWRSKRNTPQSDAKTSLTWLVYIFVFCGVNGYLFRIIMVFVPLWRPYLLLMVLLNIFVWAYVSRTRNIRVIFRALDRERSTAVKVIDILDHANIAAVSSDRLEAERLFRLIRDGATRANDSIDLLIRSVEKQ